MRLLAPLDLAAEWDNVGVLIDAPLDRDYPTPANVFLTNDLTTKVADEALRRKAHIIITYHPTPFNKFKKIVHSDTVGSICLRLAHAGVSVYAPHTALDNAPEGLNDWLLSPFVKPDATEPLPKGGRRATLVEPLALGEVITRTKAHLQLAHVRVAVRHADLPGRGDTPGVAAALQESKVKTIAVCAGAGGSVLEGVDADVILTGEMSHHAVLAAVQRGSSVVLTDHTNTERGYLPVLARRLAEAFGDDADNFNVIVTEVDTDPLVVV